MAALGFPYWFPFVFPCGFPLVSMKPTHSLWPSGLRPEVGAAMGGALGVAASPLLVPGLAFAAVVGGAGGYHWAKYWGSQEPAESDSNWACLCFRVPHFCVVSKGDPKANTNKRRETQRLPSDLRA